MQSAQATLNCAGKLRRCLQKKIRPHIFWKRHSREPPQVRCRPIPRVRWQDGLRGIIMGAAHFEKETAAFFGRGLAFGDPGIRLSPSRKVPQNRRAEETVGPLEFGDPPEVL
jgi:hypothetical protein